MQILRYTDKLQKQLNAKTKAEPWLHCAMQPAADNKSGLYVIYVWDTRQVVEEGKIARKDMFGKGFNNRYLTSPQTFYAPPARDNGQPLQGAKGNWTLDSSDSPMTVKLTKCVDTDKSQRTYDTDKVSIKEIVATINGADVKFSLSTRFGNALKNGLTVSTNVTVNGKHIRAFVPSADVPTLWPTLKKQGRPQYFTGQMYKTDLGKDFATWFMDMVNRQPEAFTMSFKRAIKAIQ